MEIIKEYDARLDNKRRITIRSSEYSDGHLELQPRILVDPEEISLNTLKMMDKSIENIKKGNVSNPVKPDSFNQDGACRQFLKSDYQSL